MTEFNSGKSRQGKSNQAAPNQSGPNQGADAPAPANRRFRNLMIGAVALTSLVGAGSLAVTAGADEYGPGRGHGMGMGMGPGSVEQGERMGERMGEGMRPRSAERGERGPGDGRGDGRGYGMDHGRGIERALDSIDATPEQREQVQAILGAAMSEIGPMMGDMRDSHAELMEMLAAPEIDRDAVEQFRADRIAEMDAASRQVLEAILDAADVLTPEQRAELAETLQERRGGWGGRHFR